MTPFEKYPSLTICEATSTPDGRPRLKVESTYGPADDGWKIITLWGAGHLRPEIEELTLIAPAGNLTPSKLKALPLATIFERLRLELGSAAIVLRKPGGKDLDDFATFAAKGARRGRPLSQAVLEETAAAYNRANESVPRVPVTDAVAQHFDITTSTAKKRIMAARAAGFLPPRRGNSQ